MTIIICCWCGGRLNPNIAICDWEYCPHCTGRFSFAKPTVLSLGDYI